jgi:hypothetical protein
MSLLTSSQLAELARITRRQAQRILDRGTPDLGARRTPGGHWEIPDTPPVRAWARHHRKWKRGGGAKMSLINPSDKSTAIVTIEGISQSFLLWRRKMASAIPSWGIKKIERAIELLAPMASLHAELCATRDRLQRRK